MSPQRRKADYRYIKCPFALTACRRSAARNPLGRWRVIPVAVKGGSLKQRGDETPAAEGILGESMLETHSQ